MNFDDVEVKPCIVVATNPTTGQVSPTIASTTPVPCGNADPNVVAFSVEPPDGAFVESGGTFPFMAVLEYSDGSKEVVTEDCTWRSGNTDVATVGESTGIATGTLAAPISGGYNTAYVSIYAVYGTMEASANLEVQSECEATALDIMLVLDRSGSMTIAGESGLARINVIREAAKNVVTNMREDRDKLGIVTYAGRVIATSPAQFYADATMDHELSIDQDSLSDALDNLYTVREPCHPTALDFKCGTGIGAGIERARTELLSGRRRGGAQPVIVVMTDGAENVESPSITDASDQAKTDGMTIVVIGVDVESTFHDTLVAAATTGKSYIVTNPEQVIGIMASIPHIVCTDSDPYRYGYGSVFLYGDPVMQVVDGSPAIAPGYPPGPFLGQSGDLSVMEAISVPSNNVFLSEYAWSTGPGVTWEEAFGNDMLSSEWAWLMLLKEFEVSVGLEGKTITGFYWECYDNHGAPSRSGLAKKWRDTSMTPYTPPGEESWSSAYILRAALIYEETES